MDKETVGSILLVLLASIVLIGFARTILLRVQESPWPSPRRPRRARGEAIEDEDRAGAVEDRGESPRPARDPAPRRPRFGLAALMGAVALAAILCAAVVAFLGLSHEGRLLVGLATPLLAAAFLLVLALFASAEV
jgi:hypothetical protein